MTSGLATILENRALLAVSGPDARSFLQGIVSNDVDRVSAEQSLWSALLTPQGKFLHEFFIAEAEGRLLLEGEAERLADLKRRLGIYKLRSKATIEEEPGLTVAAFFGESALEMLELPAEA